MHQRQLFLRHLAQTSEFPLMLEITDSEGVYIIDKSGKKYLDLIAGIGVSSLGHRHPKVVQAIKDQTDRYLHTMVYGEFVLSPQVELSSLLAKHLPDSLDSVYLVNSGTEATEGAMKLAKRYTGRTEMVACYNAYHGSTQGAASLMSDDYFTSAYRPLLPGIHHIEYNDESHLDRITTQTACVVMETVQAECGIQKPVNDYLKKVRQRCDEVGALLIFDEIQAGYGRTGSLFAFKQYDVVPDILLLAKGMGGGMPIGAFVSSKEIMSVLSFNPLLGHITTFGGHPVSCAAALATLKVLTNENYINEVLRKEALFVELLQHPKIKTIRHAGLWMAVELRDFDFVQLVIKHCLDLGLLTDWFLFNDCCLRIAPPLIISDAEIKQACAIILEAIERASS